MKIFYCTDKLRSSASLNPSKFPFGVHPLDKSVRLCEMLVRYESFKQIGLLNSVMVLLKASTESIVYSGKKWMNCFNEFSA